METIGFIGLGRIGRGMALNINTAGHPMVIYDIDESACRPLLEKGAAFGSSPAEVAAASDIVFTSLPGPKQLEEVIDGHDGLMEGIKPGTIYVDLSTTYPSIYQNLEPRFREKGVTLMDGPVLTGPKRALQGQTTIIIGGPHDAFEIVRPILNRFATKTIYAGPLGHGTICKLISNMMIFGVNQMVAEGLTLGVKAGLDLNVILEAGSGGLGVLSPVRTATLADSAFRGNYDDPRFTLALSSKDIGLALSLGQEHQVPLPFASQIQQFITQGINRGWSEKDYTIPFLLQEERAGIQVRADLPGE